MIDEAELPSEAFFKENRAFIDKWIQANTQKSKPSELSNAPHADQNKKRSVPTKPAQHNEKHRQQPNKENKDHKTAPRVNPAHPAEQVKSAPIINKTVSAPPPKVALVNTKPGPDVVPNSDTAKKKPLFQRLLQRILGR